jgi:MoaA/NifB/PqqE/SkfB family radical SAM enzyme
MNLHNFDFGKKIFFHPENIVSYKQGLRPFPLDVEIDLTNKCNHRCNFCFCAEHIAKDKSTLDKDTIIKRIEEVKVLGCKAISFTGGGEPTMHPNFSSILEFTHSLGIDCGLLTNGSMIYKYDDYMLKYLQWIRISLAGGDRDSYKLVQGVDQFDKIINDIKVLSQKKKKVNSKLNIGIRVLVTMENLETVVSLAEILKGEAINYIQFAPDMYTNDGGRFWNSQQTKVAFQKVEEILQDCEIKVLTSGYLKHQDSLSYVQKCYAHFFKVTITAEGNLIFCKNARGESKFIIGNIYNNTLKEIWAGEKNKKLESYIKPSNCNLFCKSMQLNTSMEYILHPTDDMTPNFVN